MADIVDELRQSAVPGTHIGDTMMKAAREIEHLRNVQTLPVVEVTITASVGAPMPQMRKDLQRRL